MVKPEDCYVISTAAKEQADKLERSIDRKLRAHDWGRNDYCTIKTDKMLSDTIQELTLRYSVNGWELRYDRISDSLRFWRGSNTG